MSTAQEQYVVDSQGKRTAVIVPARQYQKLMEDIHDLAVVAERREEKSIRLEAMKRRLHNDGFLSHPSSAIGRKRCPSYRPHR